MDAENKKHDCPYGQYVEAIKIVPESVAIHFLINPDKVDTDFRPYCYLGEGVRPKNRLFPDATTILGDVEIDGQCYETIVIVELPGFIGRALSRLRRETEPTAVFHIERSRQPIPEEHVPRSSLLDITDSYPVEDS